MTPDIISKLANELNQDIISERQVVYILAEIRKLLELKSINDSNDKRFFALKFYCDWAVHVRLNKSGAHRIVQRFDRYQKFLDEAGTEHGPDLAFFAELESNLQLANFRSELHECLDEHKLDSSLPSDDTKWINFLKYYSHVIEDAPLLSEAKGLDNVGSVTVRVFDQRPAEAGSGYTLSLEWSWTSKRTGISGSIIRYF